MLGVKTAAYKGHKTAALDFFPLVICCWSSEHVYASTINTTYDSSYEAFEVPERYKQQGHHIQEK